jgi:hypothetical protein
MLGEASVAHEWCDELMAVSNDQPPWRVETKSILSLACRAYDASPSSSQSASLMRTRIPGRLNACNVLSVSADALEMFGFVLHCRKW